LKKYLTTPPTLVALEPHENLQIYISATNNVVGMTIMVEGGGGVRHQSEDPISSLLRKQSAE
jgi:hypothetical protein